MCNPRPSIKDLGGFLGKLQKLNEKSGGRHYSNNSKCHRYGKKLIMSILLPASFAKSHKLKKTN